MKTVKGIFLLASIVCLLASCSKQHMQKVDGHWAVDLGTNILWATKNIRSPKLNAWSDSIMWKGGQWRRPTQDELKTLLSTCQWTWTKKGRRYGYMVKGTNGASIFLPADGYKLRDEKGNSSKNEYGGYWSSDLDDNTNEKAMYLMFGNNFCEISESLMYYLRSIRPVCNKDARR